MNLLLTNDDGYNTEGILLLKKKLSIHHKVFLCAPLTQMSASSHSITLFKPMELKEISRTEYALNGTPADCVKVALLHLFSGVRFDIVLSGINNGPNMGSDVYYSGTVAGAREGLMNGIFGVSASLDCWKEARGYELQSDFIVELLGKLDQKILSEKILLNINFPNVQNPKGIKITRSGKRIYKDIIITEMKGDQNFVTITGEDPGFEHHEGSDLNAVSDGYISLTPLEMELTSHKLWKEFSPFEKEDWKCLGKSDKL